MRYKLFKMLCLCLVTFGCTTGKLAHELSLADYDTPPGSVKLADNLFIDQSETSNFSYLEYLWWTKRVYGNQAPEYMTALPDTDAWLLLGEKYYNHTVYYLRHPAYRDYPVIGISNSQADAFCKWRADRVMEFLLITYHVIDHNPNPNKESMFTIEKYFSGNYFQLKPNPYVRYYPEYSLPDSLTYLKSLAFADSLNAKNVKSCGKKHCKDAFVLNCYNDAVVHNDTLPYGLEPLNPGYCVFCKKAILTHLKGNANELTAKPGIVFGGSFKDSCDSLARKYFYKADSLNPFTGFRNICRWKKHP